jgi:hypothetical protein
MGNSEPVRHPRTVAEQGFRTTGGKAHVKRLAVDVKIAENQLTGFGSRDPMTCNRASGEITTQRDRN